MDSIKTQGLIAAPFTPMKADGSVHLDAIEAYAHRLHRQGVVGAFVCGTTGEGLSLTVTERKSIAEQWLRTAPKELRVIVHVGHTSIRDCRELAAHAAELGADSISCMAPFFFKPRDVTGLVEWCAAVASAAPTTPFYYYNIPSMTGVALPVHDFLEAAGDRIPNLVGVKYTHDDLEDCSKCVQFDNGRFDILFGRDELLLSALKFGIRGAVGSTYNFAAPIYRGVIEAFERGDKDRAVSLQKQAVAMIDSLVKGGPYPVATFKWFMGRLGIDCGPARLPLVGPTDEQGVAMESQLHELGVFQAV